MADTSTSFVIEEFTAVARATLRGFVRIRMPSGMILHDVAIHVRDGRCWASPASRPMLDRSSTQLKGVDGKLLWTPIISFASREARDRWGENVLAALRVSHPHALEELAVAP